MRIVRTALVVAALLAGAVPRPAESQIGGFIKKKAGDIAKGEADRPISHVDLCATAAGLLEIPMVGMAGKTLPEILG